MPTKPKKTKPKKAPAKKAGTRSAKPRPGARGRARSSARARGVTVDDYIGRFKGAPGEILSALRKLVREAIPDALESVKWGQPVWESNGPLAYAKAFKQFVNFGFWRGAELDDPESRLAGTGNRMRHLKLASLQDLRPEAIRAFLKRAVELNRAKGDPSKRGARA